VIFAAVRPSMMVPSKRTVSRHLLALLLNRSGLTCLICKIAHSSNRHFSPHPKRKYIASHETRRGAEAISLRSATPRLSVITC